MHITLTNFTITLVWKREYDVNMLCHKQRTPNTNDHHMLTEPPPNEDFLCTPLFKAGCEIYF